MIPDIRQETPILRLDVEKSAPLAAWIATTPRLRQRALVRVFADLKTQLIKLRAHELVVRAENFSV
jgi:hypothetical protein